MRKLSFVAAVVAASLAVMTPTTTSALTHDKLAILSFSGPVQVPGATLSAGTYRFRLTNPTTSRNVLQVLSYDGSTVYAMFHTIPDSRTKVTYDEPVLTFRETPAGVPPAAKSLFYSHESIGYEFVYPKGGPNMTPAVFPQPEITYAETPAAPAPAPVAEPEPFVEPEPIEDAAPAPEPVQLPRTATPLPWIALGGLASLLAGVGLRRRRGH